MEISGTSDRGVQVCISRQAQVPTFISVFPKTLMLAFSPAPSFLVIIPFLFTIFISSSFGPLWQNMSAISHVHPYMDEHVRENHSQVDEHRFSISKEYLPTENI